MVGFASRHRTGGEKLGAESLSVVGFASRRPGFARPGGRA